MRLAPLRPGQNRLGWCELGLAAATTVAALLFFPVQAQEIDSDGADLARRLLSEGKILPLERIVGRACDLRQGSLIDAELNYEADHAAYVYELYMLDSSGDVWELEFEADTGELIQYKPIDH